MTSQPYQYITHPARCNRRECQARRNLSKHPRLYVRWPVCKVCGIGKMYVDWYRMRRGAKDNAEVCVDPLCAYPADHLAKTGNLVKVHRVSTKGCSGYEDYVAERSVVSSKHSPNVNADSGDPGF